MMCPRPASAASASCLVIIIIAQLCGGGQNGRKLGTPGRFQRHKMTLFVLLGTSNHQNQSMVFITER
jgi:hypothetical protein